MIWEIIKNRTEKNTIEELKTFILQEWEKLSQDTIDIM